MDDLKSEDTSKLAAILFPEIANGSKNNRSYFEQERNGLLVKRNLQKSINSAGEQVTPEVTRVGPSPTGPMHIGTLYMALVSKKIASQSGGTFYLRIEDTDKAREVEGAREFIKSTLTDYDLNFDELYTQSERVEVYKAFAYDLVARGLAYPCFMTSEELNAMREEQTAMKTRPGVYGKYAKSRDLSFEEIKKLLQDNLEQNNLISGASEAGAEERKNENKAEEVGKNNFVLRFRANGDVNKKEKFIDEFLGEHNIPENDEDFVLLKSDGVPTYHFAHVVDDYTLGTTFVTRGEEWLSSMGKHLALWRAIDAPAPKYGHIMPINKKEINAENKSSVRKLSKRKDPEASMSYWQEMGYTREAIVSYLLRLANPDLDIWWDEKVKSNIGIKIDDYALDLKQMKRGSRGPLLDFAKLDNMSADLISQMSAKEVSEKVLDYTKKYDAELFDAISEDVNYLEQILNIEREGEQKRKDIAKWSDVREQIFYFYDELFEERKRELENKKEINNLEEENNSSEIKIVNNNLLEQEKNKKIAKLFAKKLEEIGFEKCMTSLEVWMEKMKMIYSDDFAENEEFKVEDKTGNKSAVKFGQVMMTVRKSLTTKEKTPNLYYVFEVLGKERVISRLTN